MNTCLYRNGKVILENGILDKAAVFVKDGIIQGVIRDDPDINADEIIDAKGQYIAPGFIDTHIHGGAGHDVMDADYEGLAAIARIHRVHGCTAFLPTTLTSEKSRIQAAVRNVYETMRKPYTGARILGVHLEGPCFNEKFKGAQNPKYLSNPSVSFFMSWIRG